MEKLFMQGHESDRDTQIDFYSLILLQSRKHKVYVILRGQGYIKRL